MQETLQAVRRERADGDRGFTLIELLVVVVIIGVLVAIATPLYLNYRKGAENKSAMADVRNAITAVEQYYSENGNVYPATLVGTLSTALSFTAQTNGVAETATVSAGNTLSFKNNTATYVICGTNSDGGSVYLYNSATGGAVVKSTQTTLAACITNMN
jgi:type IV pilus assembly protein PilA